MHKIEVNKGERFKSDKHEGNAPGGRRQFETLNVENVKVEMTKIRRRFSRFEGHVELRSLYAKVIRPVLKNIILI